MSRQEISLICLSMWTVGFILADTTSQLVVCTILMAYFTVSILWPENKE